MYRLRFARYARRSFARVYNQNTVSENAIFKLYICENISQTVGLSNTSMVTINDQ